MTDERYARQIHALPEEQRRETAVALLGARFCPKAAFWANLGLSAAGIDHAADDQGQFHPHSLHSFLPVGGQVVNSAVRVECLDPFSLRHDVYDFVSGRARPLAVVFVGSTSYACNALLELAAQPAPVPVLLVFAGHSGVMAMRVPDPQYAFEIVEALPHWKPLCPRTLELEMLAAGVVVFESMRGVRRDAPEVVFFYSQHRPNRANFQEGEPFRHLVRELATRIPGRKIKPFNKRDLHMIGAGGLGTFAAPLLANDPKVALSVYDHDSVAASNLNRQIFFTQRLGEPKAKALCQELAAFCKSTVTPHIKAVRSADDLMGCRDDSVLVCVPDNDATRLLLARIASERGLWFATCGSGAVDGQITIVEPGAPSGLERFVNAQPASAQPAGSASCHLVRDDAICATNMIMSSLMVAELRLALSGVPHRNLRFVGDAAGNRIARAATPRREQPVLTAESQA